MEFAKIIVIQRRAFQENDELDTTKRRTYINCKDAHLSPTSSEQHYMKSWIRHHINKTRKIAYFACTCTCGNWRTWSMQIARTVMFHLRSGFSSFSKVTGAVSRWLHFLHLARSTQISQMGVPHLNTDLSLFLSGTTPCRSNSSWRK